MMNILEHDTQGATIRFDQHDLLLVMALVQEGRESFGCNTKAGSAVDEVLSLANILVEDARRRHLKRPHLKRPGLKQPSARQKIHLVAASEPELSKTATRAQ